jgi:hypothetical protein
MRLFFLDTFEFRARGSILGSTLGSMLLVTGLLAGCNGAANPPIAASTTPIASSPTPPSPSAPTATASSAPSASESTLISAKGIGAAQLGMTFQDLKQALGTEATFAVKSPFIVDFDAIAVQKNGKVQYYILYLANQSFTDRDVIQGLFTDNPKFQTAEGVGAGTTLKAAVQAYGKATLSYNLQNEGREYAQFDRQAAHNLSFATGNGNTETAGIYASPTGEYNQTHDFKPDAKIKSILLVCLSDDCAPASPSP